MAAYETVDNIRRRALRRLGLGPDSSWPDTTETLDIINDAYDETQQRTNGHYQKRETLTFITPWTSIAVPGQQNVSLFKLLDLLVAGVSKKTSIVSYDMLRSYRAAGATGGPWFAVSYVPALSGTDEFGLVKIEVHPAYTVDTAIEIVSERLPADVTALTGAAGRVNYPPKIMIPWVAWQLALQKMPSKAAYFRQEYEAACAADAAGRPIRKYSDVGTAAGFLAQQAAAHQ